jgi:hypothetical protein
MVIGDAVQEHTRLACILLGGRLTYSGKIVTESTSTDELSSAHC